MSDLAGQRGPRRQVCPYCWLPKPSQVVFRLRGAPLFDGRHCAASKDRESHAVYRGGRASLQTLLVFLPLLPNLYDQLAKYCLYSDRALREHSLTYSRSVVSLKPMVIYAPHCTHIRLSWQNVCTTTVLARVSTNNISLRPQYY